MVLLGGLPSYTSRVASSSRVNLKWVGECTESRGHRGRPTAHGAFEPKPFKRPEFKTSCNVFDRARSSGKRGEGHSATAVSVALQV